MSGIPIKIRLANAVRPDISPVEIEAIADGKQPYLLLPERIVARLNLRAICTRTVPGESGDYEVCRYVGPLQVQLGGQSCYTGAVVCGSRVRVGSVALASMDLMVDPNTGRVVTDPAGPPRITRLSA